MTDGIKRRQAILNQLGQSEKPISATRFAKEFGVSRQIIVGDVALLRAAGEEIIATARGYLLETGHTDGLLKKIAVQHEAKDTRIELETIVKYGGEVVDVIVEHALYGELVGGLHIKTQADIEAFLKEYRNTNANLLSDLTNGIHLHTIRYQKAEDLEKIEAALLAAGILYRE
ncbi:transcription repressor NadR [Enterococcus sp. 2201sp1_2201st1_B8_2201SCRN_220225]|uniref:transcription repressor NadR n=1 Tax=unclassified Enterococcus TaxID=2608891 RepID=UPI0034A43A2E